METVRAALNGLQTQMPYALATAINRTAYQVMQKERATMKTVFDRPTPFVVSGVQYQKATKENVTAIVFIAPKPAQSLIAEVEGGPRKAKPYEATLRTAGVLPSGRYAVPGSGAKLDQYGNINRDQLAAIMQNLGLLSAQSNVSKRRAKALTQSGTYFVGGTGLARHLYPGIWQRVGSRGLKPILLFVSKATYTARYAFAQTARAEVARVFAANFEAAWAKALATAR